MNFKKIIGFGILIWLIMFAVVSTVLPWYSRFLWMQILVAIVAGIVSYILAGNIHISSIKAALGTSIIWIFIGLILDTLITMRFKSEIFYSWQLWLGYLLMAIAPFLRVKYEENI